MQGICIALKREGKSSYEHIVPPDHVLRRIKDKVDFSFVNKITEDCYHPNNGQPALSAELYFKIILVGHMFNIRSNRRLVSEIKFNVLYRWFCDLNVQDTVPHHATLSRTRKRFGVKIFEKFFQEILMQCRAKGLIEEKSGVITDSTLFQSNASLDSLKAKEGVEIQKGKKKSFSNKTHISFTDPDATFAFKSGTARTLKYKAHVAIDSHHRVILVVKITTGAVHDSQPYLEQLEYVKNKSKVDVIETIADKAYGTGEIITALHNSGVKTNIPLFSSRSGSSENSCLQGFTYNSLHNNYTCQNNKHLSPCKRQGETTMYLSKAADCSQCHLKDSKRSGNYTLIYS